MKQFIIPSLIVLGLINMSCGKPKKEPPVNSRIEQSAQETKQPEKVEPDKPKKDVAIITTDFGDMVVEFFEGVAPKHVESFKLHAKNGYYNGTLFHRVIPGFMIQGGDPTGTGKGGESIWGGVFDVEFSGQWRVGWRSVVCGLG